MSKQSNRQLTIKGLCRRVGISRQGYYQGRERSKRRQQARRQILQWVGQIRASHPRMGGRKLYNRLKPKIESADITMGRDKFFDLLRANNLLVRLRRSRGPRTTNGASTWWNNKLVEAHITGPNQAYVADITYLRTLDGFCYLALISDKYSRKIVGWDVADSLELQGALRALRQALRELPEGADPIHHSDRGSQYRSKQYIKRLQAHDCTISMTEKDHCAENAQAERLNGILKNEYLLDQVFLNTQQAQRAAGEAINLYNMDRPHLSLNYNTPDQVHRAA